MSLAPCPQDLRIATPTRRLAGGVAKVMKLIAGAATWALLCCAPGYCLAGQPEPAGGPRRNAHYLAPPAPGENWNAWLAGLEAYRRQVRQQVGRPAGFDDTLYRRGDQAWMRRNFVCGFLLVYDRAFWDPERRSYRVEALCDEAQQEFGGYDSVVLWHAYPRLGIDDRNQFDFFRDMPGGLNGVRDVIRRFHARGIKVYLPYNPWDTGTRREPCSDAEALARLVHALDADGLFLDTMSASPAGLRQAVDAVRPGVAFEPEGHPAIEEIQHCTGSWAQWLQPFPGIGVLHLKWIEPRHMQHQIRRWDTSHQHELAAAWLNGSGILVWENIFGCWNPWNAEDRATLRRMAPVWRSLGEVFSAGQWLPCYPTRSPKVYASCWRHEAIRVWTLVNEDAQPLEGPVIETEHIPGEKFFDLWTGTPLEPQRIGERCTVAMSLGRFGGLLALGPAVPPERFAALQAQQRGEAARPIPPPHADPHLRCLPVVDPRPVPPVQPWDAARAQNAGLVAVAGGQVTFAVRHMRRECGCYPDPQTPPEQWQRFLWGAPHDQVVEHRVTVTLDPFWIQLRPVTNGQFEEFLRSSGYRPACPDGFLKHWGGTTCPVALRDQPVVYVDLADARAFAAWSNTRLPTEWEWQRAAEQLGPAFARSEVREWTESQRDDGHTRFVMLRGGCRYHARGSIWYFPGGPQPIESHAKYLLLDGGLDRSATIGFRCVAPQAR